MMQDLAAIALAAIQTGPQWGAETEDFNATLLVWNEGEGVTLHTNDELEVIMIGVAGEGDVVVGGETYRMSPGRILVVPKGAARSTRALTSKFSYLNIHKRRKKLVPTFGNKAYAERSLPGQPLDDGSTAG